LFVVDCFNNAEAVVSIVLFLIAQKNRSKDKVLNQKMHQSVEDLVHF
jgi:hypothetical protein